MFIGRRQDSSIYGLWTVRQWEDQEELPDSNAEVIAFIAAQAAKAKQIGNAAEADSRGRKAKLEEIEKRMNQGAPQAEINAALIQLLKE